MPDIGKLITGPRLFLLLLSLACVGLAAAQESPEVSLKGLEPYSAEFEYSLGDATGASETAGSWSDRVTVDDGQLSRTVTRYTNDGAVDLVRTVVADRETVAPVRIQQRFGPNLTNVYQIDFSGQTMTQVLIGDASRPARVSTDELDEPVVETGLQAVFALSLPMEAPAEYTVTTYIPGAAPKAGIKVFHVVGQETVEAMGQEWNTWRIEDRATNWTYWVRKEAPYIVKVVHPAPEGRMATSVLTAFTSEAN